MRIHNKGVMPVSKHWKEIGILCLIVGILGILWYIGILKYEGFANSPPDTTVSQLTGIFETEEKTAKEAGGLGDYFQKQINFFHRQSEAPILVTPSLVNTATGGLGALREKVNAALEKALIPQDYSPDVDYSARIRILSTENANQIAFNACRTLKTVEEWTNSSTTSCGWLFVPDMDGNVKLSASVNGTKAGPHKDIKYDGKPPLEVNGIQWFWIDKKTEAKQAEYAKQCGRMDSCGLLDPALPCAFNTLTGKGEYYDRSISQAAKPGLITHPNNCPKNYQFCTANLASERIPCVQKVLRYEGIPEKAFVYEHVGKDISGTVFSALLNLIYERAKTGEDMKLTSDELQAQGTQAAWNWDKWTALRKKIRYLKQVAVSYDTFLADIAQMLVYGELVDGRVFVLANYYTEAARTAVRTGSEAHTQVSNVILQKEWRKAGCQPAGSGYPTEDAPIPTGKSLTDLQREYTTLHSQSISSESQQLQLEAVRKCINRDVSMGVAQESSVFCNERGIEYFLYDGEGAQAILIGHVYSSVGLLVYGAPVGVAQRMQTLLQSASIFPTISYKVRTMLSTSSPITMTPHPVWTNKTKYRVYLNKASVALPYDITFPTGRRNILEMEYTGQRSESWGSPRYSFIDLNLDMFQLFQSSTKPLVSLNFYEGTLLDANRLVSVVDSAGIQFTTGSGTDKGIARGSASLDVKLGTRIRSKMIEIVSQRVKVVPNTEGVLFRLEDESAYSEVCEIRRGKVIYTVQRGFDTPVTKELGDISGSGWMNVALAFDRSVENQLTVTAYVNQRLVGNAAVFRFSNEPFTRPLTVLCMPRNFPEGMELAWFHIYDRKLTGASAIEGFQASQNAPETLPILAQEGAFDPQETSVGAMKRVAANIGGFLSRQIDRSSLLSYAVAPAPAPAPAPGPAPAPATVTGAKAVCEFDEVSEGNTVSANYSLGVYYQQRFSESLSGTKRDGQFLSAKECEDVCTTGCIAYTFNSADKTCTTYSDLGKTLTTVADNNSFSAIITPKNDATYDQLKADTLNAIQSFKNIRKFLKNETTLFDRAFRPRVEFGATGGAPATTTSAQAPTAQAQAQTTTSNINKLDDPRTDAEITKDENAVKEDKYRTNMPCLKAIFEKYRVQ